MGPHVPYQHLWLLLHGARGAAPHERGDTIINTGSITGLEGSKALIDYSSTKGAIHAFTKSLAQNLVDKGIRVNCVSPGPVWTPLNVADKPAKEAGKHGHDTPMKRPAQPEEVAPAFVFFASEADSSYITGEVLTLLGGETRRRDARGSGGRHRRVHAGPQVVRVQLLASGRFEVAEELRSIGRAPREHHVDDE